MEPVSDLKKYENLLESVAKIKSRQFYVRVCLQVIVSTLKLLCTVAFVWHVVNALRLPAYSRQAKYEWKVASSCTAADKKVFKNDALGRMIERNHYSVTFETLSDDYDVKREHLSQALQYNDKLYIAQKTDHWLVSLISEAMFIITACIYVCVTVITVMLFLNAPKGQFLDALMRSITPFDTGKLSVLLVTDHELMVILLAGFILFATTIAMIVKHFTKRDWTDFFY